MKLLSRDYRRIAWNALSGKWGFMIGVCLLTSLISGAVASIPGVGFLASIAITGPLSFGLVALTLNLLRNEELKINNLFCGFSNFGETFLLYFLNGIYVFLWTLLLIIPGIVKTYAYSMSTYILADNPTITQKEARKRSEQLMIGNKFRLFCLHLSFLGWFLLIIITCGIASLWVIPYMQIATAAFYDDIIKEYQSNETTNTNTTTETNTTSEINTNYIEYNNINM